MNMLWNTDDEMNRYDEADLLAGITSPEMISDAKSVFNTNTGQTDLLAPLPSGGFVKLASQAPNVMVESPTMPGMVEPLPVEGPLARAAERTAAESQSKRRPMQLSPNTNTGQTSFFDNATSEIGKGLIRGAIVEPANFLKDNFGLYDPLVVQLVDPVTGEFDFDIKILSREEKADLDARMAAGEMPYAISLDELVASDETAGTGSQAIGGMAQFVGAFAGVGKLFKVGQGFKAGMTQGAAADFLGFDGSDAGITDLLLGFGVPDAMLPDFLEKDPNDPDYIGRLQAAFEGAFIGGAIEKLIPLVGKVFRSIKDGDVPAEVVTQSISDGKEAMRQVLVSAGENAQTRITERGTGTTMMSGVDPTVITDPLVAAAGRAVVPVKLQSPSLPYNINLTEVTDPALVPSAKAASRSLSQAEQDVVTAVFPDNPDGAILEMGKIAKTKSAFPVQDGWSGNVELLSVGFKKNGNTDVNFKKVPYNFHNAPKDVDPVKWKQSIQRKTLKEVRLLATRAANGDPQALKILQEASWYRDMRARMRLEFGGLGDVYADLLGTTSAQTGVEQNWDNAIEIMRRFSRGEFDEEIAMYEAKLAAGETNPVKLGQAHNDENNPFKLIAKASGSLFNANSPSSTKALLNMFRVAKGAPKTPNFTGNLIGYTSAATVDVWAARFLNRMTGRPRLAPPTEQGVSGDHLAGSTLENPKVGAEFGFGQEVIQAVADNVNKSGILRAIDPSVGNVGADDLQAIMWFMEKEIWTNKGWTSKAGEGGSFDLEASYAGAADPDAVKAARKIANATFKPPTPLKQKTGETDVEYQARLDAQLKGAQQRFDAKTSQAATDLETATDPAEIKKITKIANATFKPPAPAKRKPRETNAEYTVRSDLRFDEAKQKHDDAVAKASKELEGYKQPLARWVLGVSIERPNKVPTNAQQADAAARLGEPAKADDAVVMYQINNSLGRFMGTNERNFNAEFVVRENFDPAAVMARMMEVAKETDQDAAFMSKVLAERSATSRPGGEIYFKKRKDAEFADLFSDELKELGVDGFTYVTDSRVMDQPGRQAQQNEDAIAGLTGIRFQYIPEFDMGADAWTELSDAERAANTDQMEELYINVLLEIQAENPDISSATLMHYETTVGERGGYDQFRAPAN